MTCRNPEWSLKCTKNSYRGLNVLESQIQRDWVNWLHSLLAFYSVFWRTDLFSKFLLSEDCVLTFVLCWPEQQIWCISVYQSLPCCFVLAFQQFFVPFLTSCEQAPMPTLLRHKEMNLKKYNKEKSMTLWLNPLSKWFWLDLTVTNLLSLCIFLKSISVFSALSSIFFF